MTAGTVRSRGKENPWRRAAGEPPSRKAREGWHPSVFCFSLKQRGVTLPDDRGHPPDIETLSCLTEVSLHYLMSDFETQDPALNHRVVIMESGIDPRVLNFLHQVHGAGEMVRCIRHQAIHRKGEFRSPEVSRQNRRDCAGHAAVRRRILWMAGGNS